ncbi:MAG TPA: ATP synthase subunit I [Bryobacteraceae bacterium]|nr:ATP synthase subunit I [Bryobacteraceae bacterium]
MKNSAGDDFYDRALRRIRLLAFCIGIAGTAGILAVYGGRPALGFLFGVALSAFNFQAVTMFAAGLGATTRPRTAAAVSIALRYAVIGCALYVILKLLGFAPLPVLAGLLAPFGATILEVFYELIFRANER